MALVDTVYSKTLMSKWVCHQSRCQNIEVLTIDGKILRYHGTSQVEPTVGHMHPLHLEIQVVEGKLLGFDLTQGFDAIKKLW